MTKVIFKTDFLNKKKGAISNIDAKISIDLVKNGICDFIEEVPVKVPVEEVPVKVKKTRKKTENVNN